MSCSNSRRTGLAIALGPKASNYTVFAPEITMPNVNLSGMTVEALMDLRKRVEEMLLEHRAKVQKQLEKMDALVGGRRIALGGRSVLKGKKVPPKYRRPSGETVVAPDLVGLLLRSRVERNSMIS